MGQFRHLGAYQANVTLPDGSVVLADPGEVHDLPFKDPGPAWAPNDAKPRKAAAKRRKAADLPAAPPDTGNDSTDNEDVTVPPKEAAS